MTGLPRFLSYTAGVLVLGSLWIWLGGCDFTRVDEGVQIPVAEHVQSLATTTNASDAERSLRQLFAKIGATAEARPGAARTEYFGLSISERSIRDVAAAQVRFNSGESEAGKKAVAVFELLRTGDNLPEIDNLKLQGLGIELEDALTALRVSAQRATADPESPRNALLVTIVSGKNGIPSQVQPMDGEHVFSPVQSVLFGLWLHKERGSIPAFSASVRGSGNPNASCPAGQVLIAKFNWEGGSYVFEKPEGNESVVALTGDASSASWISSYPILTVILKGGLNVSDDYYTFSPGEHTGSFDNSQVGDRDISNVQFCGGDEPPPPTCLGNCLSSLVACYVACPDNGDQTACKASCDVDAQACKAACHDQGESGSVWWTL